MSLQIKCNILTDESIWGEIARMYQDGLSVSEISRRTNKTYPVVNNYLIKNNVKTVKHSKLSNNKINYIIDLIKKGVHCRKIERMANTTCSTIANIAKENGLTISRYSQPRDDKNKYFRDDYFGKIDSESKAYFLGLLYTDGHVRVRNGGYYVGIELNCIDDHIIKEFANELKCNNVIYYRKRNTNYGMSDTARFESCNSKQLFDDLAVFDVIPNKTNNSESFKNIKENVPKSLIKHFLRGLVDGDGTISPKGKRDRAIAVYQNSRKFCCDFVELLNYCYGENNFKFTIDHNNNNDMYVVRYRRIHDIEKICTFLYKDSEVRLQRKFNIAKEYFL